MKASLTHTQTKLNTGVFNLKTFLGKFFVCHEKIEKKKNLKLKMDTAEHSQQHATVLLAELVTRISIKRTQPDLTDNVQEAAAGEAEGDDEDVQLLRLQLREVRATSSSACCRWRGRW